MENVFTIKTPVDLKALIGEWEILASNGHGWGTGPDITTAAKQCRKATRRNATVFAIIPKGCEISGLSITYPLNATFTAQKL